VEGRAVEVSTSGVPKEGLRVVFVLPSHRQDPSGVVQPVEVVVDPVNAVYSGDVDGTVDGQMQGSDVVAEVTISAAVVVVLVIGFVLVDVFVVI